MLNTTLSHKSWTLMIFVVWSHSSKLSRPKSDLTGEVLNGNYGFMVLNICSKYTGLWCYAKPKMQSKLELSCLINKCICIVVCVPVTNVELEQDVFYMYLLSPFPYPLTILVYFLSFESLTLCDITKLNRRENKLLFQYTTYATVISTTIRIACP